MRPWEIDESKILLVYADAEKPDEKLRAIFAMTVKGAATNYSVRKLIGVADLKFRVTAPLTKTVNALQESGALPSDLESPLKKDPSLARGDYPFEFTDEATKKAFRAALKSTVVPPGPGTKALSIPPLEGYLTSEQTAAVLGRTKQLVHRLIHAGKFKSVRRVGDGKPVYVISELEVLGLKAQRDAKKKKT